MNYKQLNLKVEELRGNAIHVSNEWSSYPLYKMIKLFGIALYFEGNKELGIDKEDLKDVQIIRDNDDKFIKYMMNFLSSSICRHKLFRESSRLTVKDLFKGTSIEDFGRSSDMTLVTLAYGIRLSEELGNPLKYKK